MNERPGSTKHTSLVGLCLAAVPDVQAVSTQYPPESAPLGPRIIYSRKPHQNSEGFLIACQCTQQLGIGTKVFDSVQSPQAWVWFYTLSSLEMGAFLWILGSRTSDMTEVLMEKEASLLLVTKQPSSPRKMERRKN